MNNSWRIVVLSVALLALVGCQNSSTTSPGSPQPGNPATVASVELGPKGGSVPVGGVVDFQARAYDSGGNPVVGLSYTFASATPGVMSVSGAGVGTAKSTGTTVVSASVNGKSASTTISVTPQSTAPVGVTWTGTLPTTFDRVAAFTVAADGSWLALEEPSGVVLKSMNAGDDWLSLGASPGCSGSPSISASPTDASIVLAACDGPYTAYRSSDGGQTWTSIGSGQPFSAGGFKWLSGSVVVKGSDVSSDGGQTWYSMPYYADQVTFVGGSSTWLASTSYPSDVKESTDLGLTWSSLASTFPASASDGVTACSLASSTWMQPAIGASGRIVLVGSTYCSSDASTPYWTLVEVSDNYGASWQDVYLNKDASSASLPTNGSPGPTINPGDQNNILMGDFNNGVSYVSADGGATWTQVPQYISGYRFDAANGNVIFGTDGLSEAWISSDKGQSWTDTGFHMDYGSYLFENPGSPNVLYLEQFSSTTANWYISTDTGATWSPVSGMPAVNSYYHPVVVGGTLFVNGPTGLYDVQFGSATAARAGFGRGLGTAPDAALAVHLDNGSHLLLNDPSGSVPFDAGWSTSDATTTQWSSAFATAVMTQAPSNMQRWYFANGSSVYVSNDNDATAAFVHDLPYNLVPTRLIGSGSNANLVYAATLQGVYKSADAAASWQWASTGLEHTAVQDLAVDPTNDQAVYAATHLGVYASTDGGSSWKLASQPLDTNALEIQHLAITSDGTTLFGSTYDHGVVRSLDGGATWEWSDQGLTTYSTTDVVADPSDPNVVYLATNTGVWKSVDKGSSWVRASHTLPYPNAQRLAISADGQHVYVIVTDPADPRGKRSYLFAGVPSSDTGTGFSTSAIGVR